MKPVWVKCLIGSLAGAGVGILLAVAHVLLNFLWLHPPHFKNDSEAMAFPIVFLAIAIGEAIMGATIGAISGSAIVLWRLHRHRWIGRQQARR